MTISRRLEKLTCIIAGGFLIGGCAPQSGRNAPESSKNTSATTAPVGAGERRNYIGVSMEHMTVSKEFFDRGIEMKKAWAEEHNQNANTHWRFTCVPKFQFDIVDKKVGPKETTVKIKIKEIILTLTAPVVVYLPKYATPDVVAHEEGHVKICRRIYEGQALDAANRAAKTVMGKEFEATDATLAEACQSAMLKAAQAIGRDFRRDTLEPLGRLSAFYDHFAPQHPEAKYVDDCIEGAFKAEEMRKDGRLDAALQKLVAEGKIKTQPAADSVKREMSAKLKSGNTSNAKLKTTNTSNTKN